MKIDTNIVEEIHGIKIMGNMTLQEIYNSFFKIMGRHGIYQWKLAPDRLGHMGNTPEYVMCYAIFKQHLESHLAWLNLGVNDMEFEVPDYMFEGGKTGIDNE